MSADESVSKQAIQTSPISHGARAIGDILAALADRLPQSQPPDQVGADRDQAGS
jgi:hypothetical protein